MRGDSELNDLGPRTRNICTCWCLPSTSYGSYLWGIVLVVGGDVWLLNNLDLLSQRFLDAFWPLLLVGVGAAFLVRAISGHSGGALAGSESDRS